MFRTPTDSVVESKDYYNSIDDKSFTYGTPTDSEILSFIENNFSDSEKDFSYYISCLQKLGLCPGASIFDFGCSWGYGPYQLTGAGYKVEAFEISKRRRAFAQDRLNVTVHDVFPPCNSEGKFDCFLSVHVLEHVPSVEGVINAAWKMLKPGSLFVAFTPNGSDACRSVHPNWSKLWGEIHPNVLDDQYYKRRFSESQKIISSSPVSDDVVHQFISGDNNVVGDLSYVELFLAVRR